VIFSFDLGYLSDGEFKLVKKKIFELRRMLNGYIRYLKKKKLADSDTGSVQYRIDEGQDIDFYEEET
jgi:hypothetical protein